MLRVVARPLVLGLVLFAASCGKTSVDPSALHVVSFAPQTKTDDARTAIRVRFSGPVVADAEVGKPLATLPLTIAPRIEVTAHFADRETLVVQPRVPLAGGTRYEVALTGVLGMQAETFTFVVKPLAFVRLRELDPDQAPPDPILLLEFNQPVAPEEVARSCRLKAEHAAVSLVGHREAGDEEQVETPTVIAMKPSALLEKDQTYKLVCEGLKATGGNDPLDGRELDQLHVHGELRELGHGPQSNDVAANDALIEVRFSTPIELEEALKHIHLTPDGTLLRHGAMSKNDTTFSATIDLQTATSYTVNVDDALTDRFGQKLDKAIEFSFVTGDASPKLSMETGIFAVEPSAAGYPVWSRNVDAFDLECASVERKNIVSLLTGTMNYDPWYQADAANVEWKKLGMRVVKTHVAVHGEKNKWVLSQLPIGKKCGKSSGLYLAEVRSQEPNSPGSNGSDLRIRRVLANVTKLGVMLKAGGASGLVWVVGITDGQPVADAQVELFSPTGRSVFRGKTDASGLLRTPGTGKLLREVAKGKSKSDADEEEPADDEYRARRMIAVVDKDGDTAVVDGNWQNGIQVWNFGVPADTSAATASVRGFIQSDRGIYRPGETVHFKGIVRESEIGKAPHIPGKPGTKIEVAVEDARGAVVMKTSVTLSSFGGFWFDLPLGSEARLGDYSVNASVSGQTFRETFFVQEFRKAEIEIRTPGLVKDRGPSRKLAFNLEAAYLFGAPAANADVEWSVQSRLHPVMFERFPEYFFGVMDDNGGWWSRYQDHPLSFVSDGKLMTDAKGRIRFAVDGEKNDTSARDYVATVSLIDDTAQKTNKQVVVTVHPTDFYLGLHEQEWVQAVAMPFAVNLVALDPKGAQVATAAELSYVARRSSCSDNASRFGTAYECKVVREVIFKRPVTLSAAGVVTERINPAAPGEFEIIVEAKDAHGRAVKTSSSVYVLGKGEAFWSGDESSRVSLIASKESYLPGETAKLVARANMAGATALVTLERNGILDAYVTTQASSGEGFSIPIKAEHAPNVFASVTLVKGRTGDGDKLRPQFRMGVADLKVSSEANRLKVSITTDGAEYRPGQPVRGKVHVVDGAGKPVVAEVSLSAADEGVLQVIAYQTPDPMKAFYAPWGLGVDTSTTLNRISRIADPNAGDLEEGGDSAPSRAGNIRSKFLSSAYWAPALVTNESGDAEIAFALPDNLTAFRLMAVAADAGSRFGSADLRITVKKPLLLRPALPEVLGVGDTAQLGVVVHNYTDHDGLVTVTADASPALELKAQSVKVSVPKNGTKPVLFSVKAGFVPEAKLTFSASMGNERDAILLMLPIDRGLIVDRERVRSGELTGHFEVPIAWNKDEVTPESRIVISVDNSGLAELTPSLRALIEYPYGCLEQTLSRFIPLTKVKELADSLAIDQLKGADLKRFIAIGAAKVVRHQHESGLFSLWPGGEPDPQLTVHALWGLSEAKRAGVKIDENAAQRGLTALHQWTLARDPWSDTENTASAAMAAYVLADMGKPDATLVSQLFTQRTRLPLFGKANLLAALKLGHGPADQIAALTSELVGAITFKDGTAMVHEPYYASDRLTHEMSSDVRSTAIALRALLLVDPKNAVIGKLAQGLLHEQLPTSTWRSTQENLYSIVALAAFARSRTTTGADVTVKLGGKLVLTKKSAQGIRTVELPLSELRPGVLTVESRGPSFVNITIARTHRDTATTSADAGFHVTREYLDAVSGEALVAARPGQLVKVRLTVRNDADRHYVALTDSLPAGLEAVNPKLANAGLSGDEIEAASSRDRAWYRDRWTFVELHEGHVNAFADSLSQGSVELTYFARAVTLGKFTALPARVEEMYRPEVCGRTGPRELEVSH